jgi:hypothetical protein
MPGFKNTQKRTGRKAVAASAKSDRNITAVLNGSRTGVFARIEKNMGSYFQLIIHDGTKPVTDVLGSPCGTFNSGGKVRLFMSAGDVVLIEGLESLGDAKARGRRLIVDIVGKLSKKDAQVLYRAGKMHRSVYRGIEESDATDDLFDFDAESNWGDSDIEEDDGLLVNSNATKKKKKHTTGNAAAAATGSAAAAKVLVKEHLEATEYAKASADTLDDEEDGSTTKRKSKKKVSTPLTPAPTSTLVSTVVTQDLEEDSFEQDTFNKIPTNIPSSWEDDIDIDAI